MLTALGAHAQDATSGLTGWLKRAKGEPSIEATMRALHTPSGPTCGAITNPDGRFATQNTRLGGSYPAAIGCVGPRATTRNNVVRRLAHPTC
ncbi:hypothetical protein [Hymenobacter sp. PAMC 26628]|uniref:hypothetical protein n=1 Tax=Hymenobacter sp. PAMC 26628 TaxID=1484118 RepID=UPI0012FFB354|nr:hypothetical protein [Hymenobacter sp. PAMC 26628]